MTINLYGIEHAFAQGLERTTTIEKFKKEIEHATSFSRSNGNNLAIPFEMDIPSHVNVSMWVSILNIIGGLKRS